MTSTTTTFTTAAEIVAHAFDDTAVYRREERVDMASVMLAAAHRLGCSTDDLRVPDGTTDWERGAQVMLDMGLDSVPAINAHCTALADVRWKMHQARMEAEDLAKADYSHHAAGCDANGAELMDTGLFSDMGMYGDMSTLAAALEWATNAFERDARVQQVRVSLHRRTPKTVGWVFHKSVTVIHRPA